MERHLKDYALPADTADWTLAAVRALDECRPGDILYLGGGEFHFYPTFAYEKFYCISNNDLGIKRIAFPIIGKENLTIDGEGARLIFHGKMMPFAVEASRQIIIRNLSIDYAEPMYFEAKITDSGPDFVEMEYDASAFHCDAEEQTLRFWGTDWEFSVEKVLVNEFDTEYKGPAANTPTYFAFVGEPQEEPAHYASLYRFVKASKPAEDKLRLEGDLGFTHTVGKYWLCTYDNREYPGIFACETKDLKILNVTLYYTASMGIICQLCENITLERIFAVPGEGRMLSVNADATHFVNCSGLIHMKDCKFESMMDDVMNVHGIYVPVCQKLDEKRVLLKFGHHQQRGVNIFKPADRICLVENASMQPYAWLTVEASNLINEEYLLLETREALPEMIAPGHVFENYSCRPEVHIEGCSSGYNRPRGFLLSGCKKAVVENCEFHNLQYAVAMLTDANSWFESGPCDEVILKNNHFENAAYSGTPIIVGGPAVTVQTEKPYHGRLCIEDNYFRKDEEKNIVTFSFQEVVIKNNHSIEKSES